MVSSYPSRIEIFKKFSSSKEKLEYLHIKSKNKQCILMYEIRKAIHGLNIPIFWKISDVYIKIIILMHKKNSTTNLNNFLNNLADLITP